MVVTTRRTLVLMLALLAAAPALSADREKPDAPAARFEFLDVNKDGVVSMYEYDSDVAFQTMDSNDDLHLSAAELQAMLGEQEDGATSAADRIVIADLDGDGQLNDDELRRATEMRFSWLDRDSDGNLDQAELRAGFGVRVRP